MPSPSALAGGRWLKLPLPTLQPSNTIMTAKRKKERRSPGKWIKEATSWRRQELGQIGHEL